MYMLGRARPRPNFLRCLHAVSPVSRTLVSESGNLNVHRTAAPNLDPRTAYDKMPEPIQSPEKRDLGRVYAPWSSNITELHTMLREHMDVPSLGGMVAPGYHQVSHKRLEPESHLCDDGAQLKYSPGEEYKYRVWSGGSMQFRKAFVPYTDKPCTAIEQFLSCRTFRKSEHDASSCWVQIGQDFRLPNWKNSWPPFDFPRAGQDILDEKKGLVFYQDIPELLKSKDHNKGPVSPVPGQAHRSITVMPTPAMLFRFSALTLNSHAIHLDREYTRSVYGMPDLVVQGPLTSVLMLELLRTLFTELGQERQTDYFIKQFTYRNLKPLWVNEEITIGCKVVPDDTGDISAVPPLTEQEKKRNYQREKWQVWISKGTAGNEEVAVGGSAIVSIAPREESPLTRDGTSRVPLGKHFGDDSYSVVHKVKASED